MVCAVLCCVCTVVSSKCMHLDTHVASIEDLGANFYLQPSDVGKNRALASVGQLKYVKRLISSQYHYQLM